MKVTFSRFLNRRGKIFEIRTRRTLEAGRVTDVLKAVLNLERIALCQKRQVAADGGDVMLKRGHNVDVCYSFLRLKEQVGDLEFLFKLNKNLH